MTTITAQLGPAQARTWGELEAVIELASKAHNTASATARRTASAHAKAKLAGELRNEHGEWTRTGAADLVVHQDGTVAHKKTGAGFGSLTHENGKWVAHHGDGTVSKHAAKAAALREIASRHNKAGAAQPTAPAKAPAVKAPAVKPPPKPQPEPEPEPPAEEDEDAKYARQEKAEQAYFAKLGDVGLDPQRMGGWGVTAEEGGAQRDYMDPSGCDVINGALRAGKMPPGHPENSHMDRADVVKNLDAVIAKNHTTKPTTVYRGMSVPPGMDLSVGSTFSDKAYVSVSTAENVAKDFASARSTGKTPDGHAVGGVKRGGRAVELVMSMPAGQPVGMGMPHLGELILPRGSQFHVDSASADGSVLNVSIVPAAKSAPLAPAAKPVSLANSAPAVKPPWAATKYKPTAPSEVRRLTWAPEDITMSGKQFSNWDQVLRAVELSAETGRLAVTPAPYGKPGGPGLYGVKGLKHSDYLENIVHALMRKGMDKGRATAIARGSIRKWMAKSKHPEVRAAAAGAETQEVAAQARAHAHAATWDGLALELATAVQSARL